MSSKYYIRRSSIRLWRKHHAPFQLGVLVHALSKGLAVIGTYLLFNLLASEWQFADLNNQLPSKREFLKIQRSLRYMK